MPTCGLFKGHWFHVIKGLNHGLENFFPLESLVYHGLGVEGVEIEVAISAKCIKQMARHMH